ncbi:hypothetical protein MLD38_026670 [Melastoma candidum]|uniref:Uncharacterized protein n=1 Tax=Melastoma candidum TaxID=119954 RepID=A0ACB9P0W4_9MYRT|nr:hypothetical protein MLD38_026670 [Melastoma candidum]
MAMKRLWNVGHGLRESIMMVIAQIAVAIGNILYKLAVREGTSLKVMVMYRLIFAAAFLAPVAFFYERKIRPRLTMKVLIQSFFCGLFGGSLAQTLFLESLALTSATYASAMVNLIPAVTLVLAALFGLEKLNIRRIDGVAKVLGTLLGLGGATLLTFYKGVEINIYSTHDNVLDLHGLRGAGAPPVPQNRNIVLGSIMAVGSCLSFSIWAIVQAKMSKEYPCQLSSTALMSFMAAIQSLVYALVRENDWKKWRLHWNISLLAIVYAGIVGSGLCITVQVWCIRTRGPLFGSVFNPLILVAVAFMAPLLLNEKLYLGSILGAVLIICGLYSVLWGQARERKKLNQLLVTSQTKDGGDDKGSVSKTSRVEAAWEDNELEEGSKSCVKKINQEDDGIIMLKVTPLV